MQSTSKSTERHRTMFSVMELRLIRHSVHKNMENLKKRVQVLDPESDEVVEVVNDLKIYQIILDKINERKDV